jgi:hypothetical protein
MSTEEDEVKEWWASTARLASSEARIVSVLEAIDHQRTVESEDKLTAAQFRHSLEGWLVTLSLLAKEPYKRIFARWCAVGQEGTDKWTIDGGRDTSEYKQWERKGKLRASETLAQQASAVQIIRKQKSQGTYHRHHRSKTPSPDPTTGEARRRSHKRRPDSKRPVQGSVLSTDETTLGSLVQQLKPGVPQAQLRDAIAAGSFITTPEHTEDDEASPGDAEERQHRRAASVATRKRPAHATKRAPAAKRQRSSTAPSSAASQARTDSEAESEADEEADRDGESPAPKKQAPATRKEAAAPYARVEPSDDEQAGSAEEDAAESRQSPGIGEEDAGSQQADRSPSPFSNSGAQNSPAEGRAKTKAAPKRKPAYPSQPQRAAAAAAATPSQPSAPRATRSNVSKGLAAPPPEGEARNQLLRAASGTSH